MIFGINTSNLASIHTKIQQLWPLSHRVGLERHTAHPETETVFCVANSTFFCVDPIAIGRPSKRTMGLGSTQPLSEISTRNLPGGNGHPMLKAGNSTACYRDSFTSFILFRV
jgi:hypothetical protein